MAVLQELDELDGECVGLVSSVLGDAELALNALAHLLLDLFFVLPVDDVGLGFEGLLKDRGEVDSGLVGLVIGPGLGAQQAVDGEGGLG